MDHTLDVRQYDICIQERKTLYLVYTKVELMAYNYKDYQQQYYLKDDPRSVEYFQSKFECRIEDSREYNQYMRSAIQYRDFYDTRPYHAEIEKVPMKAIHLSSDSLSKLMAEQEEIQYLRQDANAGKRIWQQEREDRLVRESNPAVEKAYRNYQMLLELCRK
jgi:hypothetical protein